jgi:hypothetical protein
MRVLPEARILSRMSGLYLTATENERGQMVNYLRITGHKVGVILNFKCSKLEWERIVLDRSR